MPKSETVVDIKNHRLKLNAKLLDKLLLKDDLKDHYVVVISIAGAFRLGKSFILNFFLRYLNETCTLKKDGNEWMGRQDKELKGFLWNGGSKRITTGILIWDEIFCTELKNGEKVAIILMDTQGTWDNVSTTEECVSIFAVSTLLSSIQIYNVSKNIRRDDLEHLIFFTDYGKLALNESQLIPFQKLQFLVRDWQCVSEYNFGSEGGNEYLLNEVLQHNTEDPAEITTLKNTIYDCFENIECFLMPDPGKKVKSAKNFNGQLSDIDDDFKESLNELVTTVLAKDKLIIKTISGEMIKVHDFVKYFKSFVKLFEGNHLPTPRSILSANAKIQYEEVVAECIKLYYSEMKKLCGNQQHDDENLNNYNLQCADKVLIHFKSKKKMGGEELSGEYEQILRMELEECFKMQKKIYRICKRMESKPTLFNSCLSILKTILSFLKIKLPFDGVGSTSGLTDFINTIENEDHRRYIVNNLHDRLVD